MVAAGTLFGIGITIPTVEGVNAGCGPGSVPLMLGKRVLRLQGLGSAWGRGVGASWGFRWVYGDVR